MTDLCGHPTADDGECQNPATDGGSCWLAEHGGDSKPSGRPSKLEQWDDVKRTQVMNDIASVIEQGGSIAEASRKVGIHRETIGRWMERGADADSGPLSEFHDRLVRARGEGEGTYRQALLRIAIESEDTATLMAMLKQRYPDSWGDVDRGEQGIGPVINIPESVVEKWQRQPNSN